MIVKKWDKNFQANAKKYVINMLKSSGRPTLHKKDGCYWGKTVQEYVDFDSVDEARENGFDFTKCKICFKKEREE